MIKEEKDRKNLYELGLKAGVNEFITKPINYVELKLRIKNLLNLGELNKMLDDKAKLLKEEIQKATTHLKNNEFELLEVLSKTTEYKNKDINVHTSRVAEYSKMLAQKFGLNEHKQDIIFRAAPLHDIGKVGIPDILLRTSRELKDEEFDLVKKHTLIGYDILKNSKNEFLEVGATIALTHHERFDGSGYPKGLRGHNIPIEGRIVAIADVFDNLTSDRPYQKAHSFEEAVELIQKQSSKHFDPDLVDIFVKNINQVKTIYRSFKT